jgi:oligoendopeptidase F
MTPIKVHAPRATAAKKAPKALGSLPEWNLADLYASMDAPEIKRDLDRGETECFEFEKAYKGRLADIAASSDAGVFRAFTRVSPISASVTPVIHPAPDAGTSGK